MTVVSKRVELLQGYDAVTESAIAVGCRFFSGYPMLPFTGLLESFSRVAAKRWGVSQCCQRDRRCQHGVGGGRGGARSGTGSTGQGVALMQETIAESALGPDSLGDFYHGAGPTGLFPVHPRRRMGRLPHHYTGAQGRDGGGRAHAAVISSGRSVSGADDLARGLSHW